jgi:hypothetical protein
MNSVGDSFGGGGGTASCSRVRHGPAGAPPPRLQGTARDTAGTAPTDGGGKPQPLLAEGRPRKPRGRERPACSCVRCVSTWPTGWAPSCSESSSTRRPRTTCETEGPSGGCSSRPGTVRSTSSWSGAQTGPSGTSWTAPRPSPTCARGAAASPPLYTVAVQGEAEIVRLLLEAGADPNKESAGEGDGPVGAEPRWSGCCSGTAPTPT